MTTITNKKVRAVTEKWLADMFPRECSEEALKVLVFNKAYQIDELLDIKQNGNKRVEMMHLYTEALYEYGVPEAAINMLRVLLPMQIEHKYVNPLEPAPLLNKTTAFICELMLMNHPAGTYYLALCVKYGLIEGPGYGEDPEEDGLIYMYSLSFRNNPYAMRYVQHWKEYDEVSGRN